LNVRRLIGEVGEAGGIMMTLYVFMRSDETPLKMCVLDLDALFGLPDTIVNLLGDLLGDVCDRSSDVAKILQIEIALVALAVVWVLSNVLLAGPVAVSELGTYDSGVLLPGHGVMGSCT